MSWGSQFPGYNRARRMGDDLRKLGDQFRIRMRRLLIHPAYQFGDQVESLNTQYGENLGVGQIREVETDYPFYRVKFPNLAQEQWFPEPELRRVGRAPENELFEPGQRQRAPELPGTEPEEPQMPGGGEDHPPVL